MAHAWLDANGGIPVAVWGEPPSDLMKEQLLAAAAFPVVCHQVVVLPNAHYGFGIPESVVITSRGGLMPRAAGSDVGVCTLAVRTTVTANQLPYEAAATPTWAHRRHAWQKAVVRCAGSFARRSGASC